MPPSENEEISKEVLEAAAEELRKVFLQEHDTAGDVYEGSDVRKIKEDNWYCQRFILHHKGDVNLALEMVREALKWRKAFGVAGIKESSLPLEYFKAGTVFPYKRDKFGNPILMLAVRLHHKDQDMMEEHRRFLVYWIEKHEKEESQKKMTVIFDCSSAGYSNLDLDMVRFIVNTFKNYYPWLLEAILIFDMPWLFNAAWKIIKSWLSQDAVEKIKFLNKKTILEYVDPENLPVSMGGKDTHQYVYEPEDASKLNKTEQNVASSKKRSRLKMEDDPSPPQLPSADENESLTSLFQDSTLLEVSPSSVIYFSYPHHGEMVSTYVTLKNVSSSPVAFKFKTNNIETYSVRPPTGILKVGTSLVVSIQLLAGHGCLPNDKLMVVSMIVSDENMPVADISALWLTTPKDEQHEYRIRCKYGEFDVKPDAIKRFQGEIENVHHRMSNLMLSTDSLKFQQRVMQLILFVMVLFVIALVWLLFSKSGICRHGALGGVCDQYGSVLAALVCS